MAALRKEPDMNYQLVLLRSAEAQAMLESVRKALDQGLRNLLDRLACSTATQLVSKADLPSVLNLDLVFLYSIFHTLILDKERIRRCLAVEMVEGPQPGPLGNVEGLVNDDAAYEIIGQINNIATRNCVNLARALVLDEISHRKRIPEGQFDMVF